VDEFSFACDPVVHGNFVIFAGDKPSDSEERARCSGCTIRRRSVATQALRC
jgi:hypothetical protein